MNVKKILSLLLVVALSVSAVALATAESTEPAAETTEAAAETAVAADAAETAETPVYTLDEMLNMAMADAYARQAAYAAYAAAFTDSRSITGVDMGTQIVLLEMLLKANGVALPAAAETVTAPATKTEAYRALATAESDAVRMYRSFLSQESLPDDARIIFRSVVQDVRNNVAVFARKAQSAEWADQWNALLESENTKVYQMQRPDGRGQWTVYVYNSNPTDETAQPADTTDTTDGTAPESTGA